MINFRIAIVTLQCSQKNCKIRNKLRKNIIVKLNMKHRRTMTKTNYYMNALRVYRSSNRSLNCCHSVCGRTSLGSYTIDHKLRAYVRAAAGATNRPGCTSRPCIRDAVAFEDNRESPTVQPAEIH